MNENQLKELNCLNAESKQDTKDLSKILSILFLPIIFGIWIFNPDKTPIVLALFTFFAMTIGILWFLYFYSKDEHRDWVRRNS